MIRHEFLDDDLRDHAAEFVLGSLDEGQARSMRVHLSVCAPCRLEVDEISALVRELLLATPTCEPPARLWARIVERIDAAETPVAPPPSPVSRALATGATEGAGEFSVVASGEGGWMTTGVPGVDVRRLHLDPQGDRVTFLARMAAGASYPRHRHAGPEECYVIQGDLWVGDRRLASGDFQRAEAGSVHAIQSTREGCVLLIVSSLQDEVLG